MQRLAPNEMHAGVRLLVREYAAWAFVRLAAQRVTDTTTRW